METRRVRWVLRLTKEAGFRVWRDVYFNRVVASVLIPVSVRWILLRIAGIDAQRCRICPTVWFGNSNVKLGRSSFVNYGVRFNSMGGIQIGRNCDIGMGVSFITQSHEMGSGKRRAGAAIARPILVGDGVWIGANATILGGVEIGDGAVVAAGAVVTGNCQPNKLYGGVPAREIRSL